MRPHEREVPTAQGRMCSLSPVEEVTVELIGLSQEKSWVKVKGMREDKSSQHHARPLQHISLLSTRKIYSLSPH